MHRTGADRPGGDQGRPRDAHAAAQVKFGRLSSDTTRRLTEASLEDLGRWTERILVADRLEDVFTKARVTRPRRSGTRRPRKS